MLEVHKEQNFKLALDQAKADAEAMKGGRRPAYRYLLYPTGRIVKMPADARITYRYEDPASPDGFRSIYEAKGARFLGPDELVPLIEKQQAEYRKNDEAKAKRKPN